MSDNKQPKKKITLADLGVDTGVNKEEPEKEEIETKKDSGIITPQMVGGPVTKDGKIVSANIDALHPVEKKQNDSFIQQKYDLIDTRLDEEKAKIKKEILDPLKEKCDTEKVKYELEIGRELEKGEDPVFDEKGHPVDPKLVANNKSKDVDIDKELDEVNVDIAESDGLEPVESNIRKKLEDGLNSQLDMSEDDDITDLFSDEPISEREQTKEEKASEEKAKEQLKDLQDTIKKATNTNMPDISKFSVSSAPISVTKIFNKKLNNATETTATVPLINTGRLITLSSLRGDEIAALDPDTYGRNALNQLRNIYSIIYKHDVSPSKPDTFVKWLKSICDFDTYQLYWGLYKATFKDSNFITYECPECKSVFMLPQPIDKMCRINPAASDDIKAKVKDLEENGTDVVFDSLLKSNIVPISNKYALSLKAPSIYANLFETSMLEEKYVNKYSQIISIIPYIEAIYLINAEKHSLIPIDIDVDLNNATRTVKHKIAAMYKIVKEISTDEYAALSGNILNISIHQKDAFQYINPAADCTGTYTEGKNKGQACHHHFEDEIVDTPLRLLFSRQQLVTSANFIAE
jgi:hypothetical protein